MFLKCSHVTGIELFVPLYVHVMSKHDLSADKGDTFLCSVFGSNQYLASGKKNIPHCLYIRYGTSKFFAKPETLSCQNICLDTRFK